MSGNTLGTLFRVTSFGESHGPAIGCVVDGCPPGLALTEADIQQHLDRRRPGTSRHVTQRREPDTVEILSGVFEGRTTGTPIALLIRNQDARSKDYANIARQLPARATPTTRTGTSTASATIAAAAGSRRARRRCASRQAPSRASGSTSATASRCAAHLTHLGGEAVAFEGWQHVDDNPFFVANARRCRRSRRTWTGCASPAIRSARGSR